MSRKKLKEPVFDDDNPEWTEADFAKAKGPGWQSRIDEALRKIAKKAS
jgi:BrnA antitoxin of type II toxin-antitoxin system